MYTILKEIKFRKLLVTELFLFLLAIIINIFSPSIKSIILNISMYIIPTAWLAFELFKHESSIKILFIPIKSSKIDILKSLMIMFMFIFSLFLGVQFLGITLLDSLNYNLSKYTTLEYIFYFILFAPIAEEIFFRGYVLNKLLLTKSTKKAIILSSIIFSIPHFTSCINAFIIGCILSIIYIKYKNLFLTMILHGLYNGCLILYKYLYSTNAFTITSETAFYLFLVSIFIFILSLILIINYVKHNQPLLDKNELSH